MTIIFLMIFLWQIALCIIADEDEQASKFESIWNKFLEDTGLEID